METYETALDRILSKLPYDPHWQPAVQIARTYFLQNHSHCDWFDLQRITRDEIVKLRGRQIIRFTNHLQALVAAWSSDASVHLLNEFAIDCLVDHGIWVTCGGHLVLLADNKMYERGNDHIKNQARRRVQAKNVDWIDILLFDVEDELGRREQIMKHAKFIVSALVTHIADIVNLIFDFAYWMDPAASRELWWS